MINKIIRNFLIKQTAGRADDGIMITLRDPQKVEMLENIMADLLMRNGIDPRAITSEAQLKGLLNQIEAMTKQSTTTGIRNVESAKVFDLKGKEIPKGSKIMGGKAVDDKPPPAGLDDYGEFVDSLDLPPRGSRGGLDDIAAPVQSSEETLRNMTEAEIKREIEENNKSAVKKILERKNREDVYGLEDYDTTNMSEVQKQIIKLETRLGNLNPELPGFRDRARVLVDEIENLKNKTRDDKADGGIMRLGFKNGMNRRTFMKIFSGLVALPIIGKVLKPLKVGKTVTKVPIIKTDNVPGKPEWFDQLVNKVILEGDDVTKRFATKDREIVHMKKIDDDNTVTVTQDLDEGAVRVEYDSPANTFEDTVQLRYKKPNPDEGDPRPSAEFDVAESGPVGRVDGPDDFSLDVDEVGGTSIKDLDSDVSMLKQYATGKKPTMKELVQNIKRKDKAKNITEDLEAQSDAVIRRQGDYDPSYDDYASGGIAGMLGE